MTGALTPVELKQIIYDTVKAAQDNLKPLERVPRTVFGANFDKAAKLNGGPCHFTKLRSPVHSDDDGASQASEENDVDQDSGTASNAAKATERVTMGAVLMSLIVTVEAQAQLAKRLRSLARSPYTLAVIISAEKPYVEALQRCYEYVYELAESTLPDPLDQPASRELCEWRKGASEVCRRTQDLLAWVQLKKLGDDLVQNTLQQEQPQARQTQIPSPVLTSTTPAAAVPEKTNTAGRQPTIPTAATAPDFTAVARVKAAASPPASGPATPVTTTTPPTLPHRRACDSKEYLNSDDDDGNEHRRHIMDATGVLNDVAATLGVQEDDGDEICFNVLDLKPVKILTPREASVSPVFEAQPNLFGLETVTGRRNRRAVELLNGYVCQTDEPLTVDRLQIIAKCATVRDLMCILGKTDYNILTYQVRSTQLQIGESGPLMWAAALDVCISEDYNDTRNLRRKWKEECAASEPPEASEKDQYRWVELIQSEPCTRGSHAKARIVSMAANLLFPREFDYYRSLERDDAIAPDNSPEWQSVRCRTVGLENKAPYGRMVTFMLNRTSFISQAYQLMEKLRPKRAPLSIDIAQELTQQLAYNSPTQVSGYTVSVIDGSGTVLVKQSSREHSNGYEDTASFGESAAQALVPTLFVALRKAAKELGVLDSYALLKKSYNRLRLPVANEPREYVINCLSLVFGMRRSDNGVMRDTMEVIEQSVAGGWSSTVRIAYTRFPAQQLNEPAKNFHYVDLNTCVAGTKKAARNEALLQIGKTSFIEEVLRMLNYGPVQQKAHAEVLLLVKAHGVFANQAEMDGLDTAWLHEMKQLAGSNAPGGAVARKIPKLLANLSLYDQIISETLGQNIPKATAEMESWLRSVFPSFDFKLIWDDNVINDFLSRLPHEDRAFGEITFPYQAAVATMVSNGLEKKTDERFHISINGWSPILALFLTIRSLRDRLDNPPPQPKFTAMHTLGQVTDERSQTGKPVTSSAAAASSASTKSCGLQSSPPAALACEALEQYIG